MVKLLLYDQKITDNFEEMVYQFLYSKNITEGNYAISFPHEQITIEHLTKAMNVPYFNTSFSLTPDLKLEYIYVTMDDNQTTKLINSHYI